VVRTRESRSPQTYERPRQGTTVRGEDDPSGMEKRSLTDPGSRGFSGTDDRTNTPESYETRSGGPNASDGQPDEASYTTHDERGQTSLTTERYDSGV
jgi:hypothetical protein